MQKQKTQKYTNNQKRFNVHIALHYEFMMREYNMPNNVNVFIDEDKHKYVTIQLFLILLTSVIATSK